MNVPSSGENFRYVRAASENGHLDEVVHCDMNLCRMRMVLVKRSDMEKKDGKEKTHINDTSCGIQTRLPGVRQRIIFLVDPRTIHLLRVRLCGY